MEHEKPKDGPTGDVEAKRATSSIEDKHFGLINEKGDHNLNRDSAVHNATKALLANESGAQAGSFPEPRNHPSALKNPQTIESNEDGSSTQKRTESPDSEIVVIDDIDERQSIGSGLDSDIEDNVSDVGEPLSTSSVKQYDPSIDDKLPDTVTLLTAPDGGKVYLVGTAHFSLESQHDVSKIIQAVQPHIVVVELCKSRVHILQLDEKTILEEAQNLSFQKILDTIQQNGLYNGLMYLLLLTVSARLTKELGMAPGGEFRTAFAEVKKIPNCLIHMGDRSISITIQRALSFLSWRQTLKLVWHLLTSRDCITKEDIERCKRRDLLEETLAEMTGEFPALGEVFVKERDIYLTHSLQLACLPQRTPNGLTPTRVVGVVGIGHAPGIVQYWGKVKPSEIAPILKIPPPSLSSKILRLTIKASLVGAVIYVGYKIIPLPSGVTFQSVKSSVEGLLKISWLFRCRAVRVSMEAVTREDEYEHVTPDVMYITSNIPGPGINLDDFESEFSDGCTCKSSCTTSCSCTRDFPNYTDSRINQDKLSGPIVECNSNCKCDINCGNRLVQHGPLDCLTVRETQGKGLGLVTEKIIRKGQFICEYAGEVIGLEEARRRVEINKRTNSMNYVLVVSEHVSSNTIVTCIDPKYFGNIGRHGNHSCQPNSTLVPVRVEGVIPRLSLFASRDIQANEEVTFDYGGGLENSVQVHSDTPCLCGADNCLGYLPHHPI